jgi:hypothetical protein
LCRCCYDQWLKRENPEYRNRQRKNNENWLAKLTPERKLELQGYRSRRWRELKNDAAHKRARRSERLVRKYNLTANEYDAMLAAQGGGCAICSRRPGKTPLHVDHDHATGRVRGILCHQCNWYLGTIDADPNILPRLIAYATPTPQDGNEPV